MTAAADRLARRLTATAIRRRLLIALAVFMFAATLLPLVLNAGLQLLADAATSGPALALPADSIVSDRSGTEIADVHPAGATRLPVALNAMSTSVQKAVVDIEDRHFWSEGAVDFARLASATLSDIRGRNAQGASTLPMQLVKILYLSDNRTVGFKLQQIALAQRLVDTTPKTTILDEYLNDAYFGEGATGLQAAAHVYFGLDAGKLDLAESAMLAGLPNAPSDNDPMVHPNAAKARQKAVLSAMVTAGDINAAQANAAAQQPLQFAQAHMDDIDLAPAFVNRALAVVASSMHLDPQTAGLRITTTLDLTKQRYAQQSVSNQIEQLGSLHVTDGAAIEIDPNSGDVLAYVSSAGQTVPGGQLDLLAAPRQPGSSFKLFTYATAIADRKVSMVSQVLDGPLRLPTGGGANGTSAWMPLDYDRTWHGPQPIERALGNSLNIPAIRTELVTGIPAIVNTARAMGVTTLGNAPQSYGPSLTIGTYAVPLWEMAQAAGVFATGGTLHAARFVLSVAQSSGGASTLPAAARRVLDPSTAFVMNSMLSNDANRAMEFGAGSALTVAGHNVAAKTGTSEDFRDNVTIGWTPHLITATWVGNADDSAMRGTTGITGAAPIWHEIMSHELGSGPDDWPAAPAGLITQSTPYGTAYFIPGTDSNTGEPALMTLGATQEGGGGRHGGDAGGGDRGGGGHHH